MGHTVHPLLCWALSVSLEGAACSVGRTSATVSHRLNEATESNYPGLVWVRDHAWDQPPAWRLAAGSTGKHRLCGSILLKTHRSSQPVHGCRGEGFTSLAAPHQDVTSMEGATQGWAVQDRLGSMARLCKACSVVQRSSGSLKILFQCPTV